LQLTDQNLRGVFSIIQAAKADVQVEFMTFARSVQDSMPADETEIEIQIEIEMKEKSQECNNIKAAEAAAQVEKWMCIK